MLILKSKNYISLWFRKNLSHRIIKFFSNTNDDWKKIKFVHPS